MKRPMISKIDYALMSVMLMLGALPARPAYAEPGSIGELAPMISYFHATPQGETISIDWSTASETGIVGFNLYVEDANGKYKLNDQLIPSTGFTTLVPQDYHFATSTGLPSGGIKFSLEAMDRRGKTTQSGPFELDRVYGQRLANTPTGWQQIAAQNAVRQNVESLANSRAVNQALQAHLQALGSLGGQAQPAAGRSASTSRLYLPLIKNLSGPTPPPIEASKLVITGTLAAQSAGASQNLTIIAKNASGNTATAYSGPKGLTFFGASPSTNPVTNPTVTNSSGEAIRFGWLMTINFDHGVATVSGGSNGVMSLYKAEVATICVTDGLISSTGSDCFNVVVSPGTATKLAFSSPPVSTTTEVASSSITVQRQDAYGNPNTAEASRTVSLTSSSSGTVTFNPASPLTISSGFSSASFTYTDTQAGAPTITAASTSPTSIASATQTETIYAVVRIGDLLVSRTGIQRLSYADLLAAGLDLSGQPAAQIALTLNGQAVPIKVTSPEIFGPGSTIEFYGQALDTLYTDTNVYTLWINLALALRVDEDSTPADPNASPASYYMETALVNNNKGYDELSTTGDPWFDTRMVAYTSPMSWNYPISVDHYQAGAATASLQVNVYGGTDLPGGPDHHMLTSFNGMQVANETFDGLYTHNLQVSLPGGSLLEGGNTLTISLPGDTSMPADAVYMNQYSVSYPRAFWAVNGSLNFSGSGPVFEVQNLTETSVVVYRRQNGTLTRLDGVSISGSGPYTARFNGSSQTAVYYVAGSSALLKPGIQAARIPVDITSGSADYLVISHPNFIPSLTALVQARTAQGLSVRVVDVLDVYDQFSYGVFDPQAIKSYITYAAQHMETQYVLLVGDDTYDYKDYLKLGSISFIPSIYMAVGDQVQFAPVDPKYVDVNNDNIPDLAIGRLAVRTPAELGNLISKTLAYGAKSYGKTDVIAADTGFSAASNELIGKLPGDWTTTTAYLDTLGVTLAHNTLLASLNTGVALTLYAGHTDDWEWTWQGLFSVYDAPSLTNTGMPTLIVQQGCWNNYYVNPTYDNLGDEMLNKRLTGAVGMFGSTTLSFQQNEQALGLLFLPLLTQPGMTLGQAELQAKQALAASNPGALDVLLGTFLEGDPGMLVTP
jgi:hypothetical protein